MINQGNDVPVNTIAVFLDPFINQEYNKIEDILSPIEKTRDWFTPHFYRCLPLTIGNQYGFVVKTQYSFDVVWDGGNEPDSIKINPHVSEEEVSLLFPKFDAHFGSGILTVVMPMIFRTPPGINLMTISPPNYITSGINVMTGVVETDNLRNPFTFNLKLSIPNLKITIPKGYPVAAFIPIPRYFVDSFKLVNAEEIFDENTINEEFNAMIDFHTLRTYVEPEMKNQVNRLYLKGKDVYENDFTDHQGV